VAHDFATGVMFHEAETVVGRNLWALAIFNMIAGYAASLALGFFVLRGRRIRGLIPHLIFIPVYWLFISAAAYRAVWQFATDPQKWEKTPHGISRFRPRRAAARRAAT
jgi:ABC-type sugar transport system permease subunit